MTRKTRKLVSVTMASRWVGACSCLSSIVRNTWWSRAMLQITYQLYSRFLICKMWSLSLTAMKPSNMKNNMQSQLFMPIEFLELICSIFSVRVDLFLIFIAFVLVSPACVLTWQQPWLQDNTAYRNSIWLVSVDNAIRRGYEFWYCINNHPTAIDMPDIHNIWALNILL